jgi:hypothetical protein
MSLENSTLRSIWVRPVLLRDELRSTISARCSKAAGSPDRILRNGPQVAATSFGYQGMSMIAVAGRDMAARDAPARAAGRAGLCAAGRQRRPFAGVQQQWPRVEIPDGLASEVVESSEYADSIAGL